MDGTVAAVRDSAAETLGMTMRVIGEKAMLPYVDQLDKIKSDKVCTRFIFAIYFVSIDLSIHIYLCLIFVVSMSLGFV